jgi:hypothetical protein
VDPDTAAGKDQGVTGNGSHQQQQQLKQQQESKRKGGLFACCFAPSAADDADDVGGEILTGPGAADSTGKKAPALGSTGKGSSFKVGKMDIGKVSGKVQGLHTRHANRACMASMQAWPACKHDMHMQGSLQSRSAWSTMMQFQDFHVCCLVRCTFLVSPELDVAAVLVSFTSPVADCLRGCDVCWQGSDNSRQGGWGELYCKSGTMQWTVIRTVQLHKRTEAKSRPSHSEFSCWLTRRLLPSSLTVCEAGCQHTSCQSAAEF